MDRYASGITKFTSNFFLVNSRLITILLISSAVIVTLILILMNKYVGDNEIYLLIATFYDISCVCLCLILFVNLCIGYGNIKLE